MLSTFVWINLAVVRRSGCHQAHCSSPPDDLSAALGPAATLLSCAVVVQDGGVAGTLVNLFALGVIVLAAQEYWSATRIWATFWLCTLACPIGFVAGTLPPYGRADALRLSGVRCR